MFIGAVVEFGKIDMIGHSLIMVVLFAIAADNRGKPRVGALSLAGAGRLCGGAGCCSWPTYYVAHSALFGTLDHLDALPGRPAIGLRRPAYCTCTTSFIFG